MPYLLGPDPHSYLIYSDRSMEWIDEFLKLSVDSLNVTGYHMYPMGGADTDNLERRFINPDALHHLVKGAEHILKSVQNNHPGVQIWASESSSANNSGRDRTTNTFLNSFWYASQLGYLAKMQHKAFCRQAFIGGFYEVVDKHSLHPNPDYYIALLWKKVMEKNPSRWINLKHQDSTQVTSRHFFIAMEQSHWESCC